MVKKDLGRQRLIKEITKFLQRVGAEEAIFFGSRVKGEELTSSDIDLIIISEAFAKTKFVKRLYPLHKEWNLPYFLEALPYTKKELKKLARSRGIIQKALKEGIRITA